MVQLIITSLQAHHNHTTQITLRHYGASTRNRVVSYKIIIRYTVRHTGAIKVYEKTGSLTVLQQVMGHADLKTSLTYLRGLEIQQLEVGQMPELV